MQSPSLLKPGKRAYYKKIVRTFGSALIGYWPLWESGGSVAADKSGNARHGAYTGVDFGYPGFGDGKRSPYFDGVNDYVDLYSAGLAGAFNGAEGTAFIWARLFNSGVWTDGLSHYLLYLSADAANLVAIIKSLTNNRLLFRYFSGAVQKYVQVDSNTFTTFTPLAITWSKSGDAMKAYLNGAQTGATQTGLDVWAGSLSNATTLLGAISKAPVSPWYGWLAGGFLLNRPASAAEITIASRLV